MKAEVTTLDLGMARGLGAFRWFALLWAWVGLFAGREHLESVALGVAALSVATVVTAATTAVTRPGLTRSMHIWLTVAEVVVASVLLLGEDLVYEPGRQQSLAWAWPAAGIIAMALALGPGWSIASAVVLAVCSYVGESMLRGRGDWSVSAASKAALLVLAALSASAVVRVLRRAEAEISTARAREEMGVVLHDGVLQTLAVIQRRSTDDQLRALAAEQERDLREYIAGRSDRNTTDMGSRLRSVADVMAKRYKIVPTVVLADDLPDRSPTVIDEVARAVGEALNNAAKHSGADRITVFAEPDGDGVYCSVSDNGGGFDVGLARSQGRGLVKSIEHRIDKIGGRVAIRSSAAGTEVEIWVP